MVWNEHYDLSCWFQVAVHLTKYGTRASVWNDVENKIYTRIPYIYSGLSPLRSLSKQQNTFTLFSIHSLSFTRPGVFELHSIVQLLCHSLIEPSYRHHHEDQRHPFLPFLRRFCGNGRSNSKACHRYFLRRRSHVQRCYRRRSASEKASILLSIG